MKTITWLLLAALLSFRSPANAAEPDPLKEGPYPVGVSTAILVDNSRTDAFTKKPRTLVTEVWHPAADGARKMAASKFSDFVPGGVTPELADVYKKARGKDVSDIDKTYWMHSVRDAPVRSIH